MKEDTKVGIAFLVVISLVIGCLIGNCWQYNTSVKYVVIEDEVVDVDLSHDEYMTILFDNGERYNITYEYYNAEVDFTVNSKMKIKLKYSSWWLAPNSDDIWSIVQIVKVPD